MTAGGEEALVDFVGALRFEDLPDTAVEATLALVLDQFSCCLMPFTFGIFDKRFSLSPTSSAAKSA